MQTDNIFRYRNANANGRVDLTYPTQPAFMMNDPIPTSSTSYEDALNGSEEKSEKSRMFFSNKNIELIQHEIQSRVYVKSKRRFRIGTQNEDNLKIIMRSIYLDNAHRLFGDVPHQVNELNEMVLDMVVPLIMEEAEAYIRYRHDASTLVVPLERPMLMTEKGKAPLEWKGWF